MISAPWQKLKDHLGKVLSTIGAALAMIDVVGVADPLKQLAREAFGPKAVSIVAAALFFALLVRTWLTGRRVEKIKNELADQGKPE